MLAVDRLIIWFVIKSMSKG